MNPRFLLIAVGLLLALPASAQTITPQGRLTLTSGQPVMTGAGVVGATTVYYTAAPNINVPVYNGATDVVLTITAGEIPVPLSATNILSGNNYDIWGISNVGALQVCVGNSWTTGSISGQTVIHGSLTLDHTRGYWTNQGSLTNCYGSTGGTTDYGSISADQATYLGSLYATANGQTTFQLLPAAAAGGSNTMLALYNPYQQRYLRATSGDSTATWSYGTATWRVANAGGTGSGLFNRISVLDGLGQSQVSASYVDRLNSSTATGGAVGVNVDATTGIPTGITGVWRSPSSAAANGEVAGGVTSTNLGWHYFQAMESAITASSVTFYGSDVSLGQNQILSIGMMN